MLTKDEYVPRKLIILLGVNIQSLANLRQLLYLGLVLMLMTSLTNFLIIWVGPLHKMHLIAVNSKTLWED